MNSQKVITMNNLKNRTTNNIDWEYCTYNKDGQPIPLKIWENLKVVLEKNNIMLRLNLINHEIDFVGLNGSESRNGRITDIYSLQMREGLKMSRAEVESSIVRIAELNAYNPFLDMLRENETADLDIIKEVYECLNINESYSKYNDFFQVLFTKWAINVVKMAHNTLQDSYRSQGVLILQGKQGARKSTFFEHLMNDKVFYKGDMSLMPDKTDSIVQNTKYILVEWGEIDSTLKGEQAKLKQFITASDDEYRVPYAHLSERYPRITSYCGSVNKTDFLKDETGSRRFWVLPISGICNIEKLDSLDVNKFWGAIYFLWKNDIIRDYLDIEEQSILSELNNSFNYETDTTIILNEKLDWESDKEDWEVYNVTQISDYLFIKDKKQLKNELEKRGLEYKQYRLKTGKTKWGFKIPRIEVSYSDL